MRSSGIFPVCPIAPCEGIKSFSASLMAMVLGTTVYSFDGNDAHAVACIHGTAMHKNVDPFGVGILLSYSSRVFEGCLKGRAFAGGRFIPKSMLSRNRRDGRGESMKTVIDAVRAAVRRAF
jgi:hypothetical protein